MWLSISLFQLHLGIRVASKSSQKIKRVNMKGMALVC